MMILIDNEGDNMEVAIFIGVPGDLENLLHDHAVGVIANATVVQIQYIQNRLQAFLITSTNPVASHYER